MKKLILAAALSLLATGAFAQTSFNVKAALNLSNHISDTDSKVKPGFKAGIGMEYAFNELVSLQPSLMFATKGTKYDIDLSVLGRGTVNVNQMYLELPVMVGFRFNIGGNTNILLSVGPYFAYGVGGKTKVTGDGIVGLIDGSESKTFGKDDMNMQPFDVGAGVGVAFEFGRFSVGIDSEFGFMNLVKEDSALDNLNVGKATNISVGIGVGYRF